MVVTRSQAKRLVGEGAEAQRVQERILTPNNQQQSFSYRGEEKRCVQGHENMQGIKGTAQRGLVSHPIADQQTSVKVCDGGGSIVKEGLQCGNASSSTVPGTLKTGVQESRQGPLPDGSEPPAVCISYPKSSELGEVDVGDDIPLYVDSLLVRLQSKDWCTVCMALTDVRALAVHQQDVCQIFLEPLIGIMIKSIKSLRSALSKTAILAVQDMYVAMPTGMLCWTDVGGLENPNASLLGSMLMKAASKDKMFVVEEARRGLESMADNLPPDSFVQMLLPYVSHKNPEVRGQAALTICKCLESDGMTGEKLLSVGVPKLLRSCEKLRNDKSAESRRSSKAMTCFVLKSLEAPELRQHVLDTISSVKPKKVNSSQENEAQLESAAVIGYSKETVWYCAAVLGKSESLIFLRNL